MRRIVLLSLLLLALAGIGAGWWWIRTIREQARFHDFCENLETRLRRWEEDDHPRPPLFGPASEGTAREHYLQAVEVHDDLMKRYDRVLGLDDYETWKKTQDWEPPTVDTEFSPLRRKSVEYLSPVLRPLLAGVNSDRYGVSPMMRISIVGTEEETRGVEVTVALFPIWREAIDSALLAAREGRSAEATRLLLAVDRVGEDLAFEGDWGIGTTVRYESLRRLVERRVRDTLGKAPGLWAAVEAQVLGQEVACKRVLAGEVTVADTDWRDRLLGPGLGEQVEAVERTREVFEEVRRRWPADESASLAAAYEFVDGSASPEERSGLLESRLPESALERSGLGPLAWLRGTLYTMTFAETVARWREVLLLGLALLRYREDHDAWPETIAPLLTDDIARSAGDRSWTLSFDAETGKPSIALEGSEGDARAPRFEVR
jgi:hypothetical protein